MSNALTALTEPSNSPVVHDLRRYVLRRKFDLRSLVARHVALAPFYQLVIWWTQYKVRDHIDVRECRVGSDTELVLDGFQGSGNTFATVAFKESQTRPVRIAHHLHAPAQIIKAVRQGTPALVTIRHPRDAVLSLVSRWPYVTAAQALRSYAGFYSAIEPYTGGYVLSSFDQTTGHLNCVIDAVNQRFGTTFDLFDHSDDRARSIRGSGDLRKSAQREAIKAARAPQMDSSPEADLLHRAEAVYERLSTHAVGR